jgi:hypothetical protein
MGPNRRAQERERAAARAAAEAKRAEAERKALVDAQKIVVIFNARSSRRPCVVVLPDDAGRLVRLICARSIDTPAARSRGSFRHCPAGGARRTRRSPTLEMLTAERL